MNKTYPHSIEAERVILGQAMVDNSVIDQISQYIPEEQVFYNSGHQEIWKCILSLHREGASVIDPITVNTQMPKNTNLESPAYYLTGLIDEVVTTDEEREQLKQQFQKVVQDHEKDMFALEVQDRSSARTMFSGDGFIQKVLAVIFTSAYFFISYFMFKYFVMNQLELSDYEIGFISTVFGAMSSKVKS